MYLDRGGGIYLGFRASCQLKGSLTTPYYIDVHGARLAVAAAAAAAEKGRRERGFRTHETRATLNWKHTLLRTLLFF